MSVSALPQARAGFQMLKRLAAFLSYSLTNERGINPSWVEIGYSPSPLPPSRAPRLNITAINRPTTLDCDVCIIGSGAGGGVAAGTIAASGKSVIVLEAGPPDQGEDFQQREYEGMRRLYLDRALTASRDASISILGGACIGGGTVVNWQTSLRTPDAVRAEWADQSGCDALASAPFDDALDAVCARSSVSTDESVVNGNNATLERGCRVLGYSSSAIPRNSRGCDATQCGYCVFGCRIGSKQSTAVTYLRDAQQHGDTRIIAQCKAERILQAGGRVTGVEAIAFDADGDAHAVEVRAARVVVAAGGIESPALLLRSGISLPLLGRNLLLHPTTAVVARYAERTEPWIGAPQTILCDQFGDTGDGYGFRLETAPGHPGLLALTLPWTSAAAHRDYIRQCAHMSAIIVLSRDREGGRVSLFGSGRASIHYKPGARERILVQRGIAAAVRVHLAAGAEEVMTLHSRGLTFARTPRTTAGDIDRFCERAAGEPTHGNWSPLFSAHQMSTCRMGRDQRTGVCDSRGEVFGVRGLYVADASLFPASSGVNPMITVMALARMVAAGMEG